MSLKEKEVEINGVKFRFRELSTAKHFELLDGFSHSKFVKLSIAEPTDLDFLDDWPKKYATELVTHAINVNKDTPKGDDKDFQSTSQAATNDTKGT